MNCFYAGKLIGSCAVVVNPGSSTITIPGGYTRSLVLTGGGILDGGTANVNGPTVNQLGPISAAILFS